MEESDSIMKKIKAFFIMVILLGKVGAGGGVNHASLYKNSVHIDVTPLLRKGDQIQNPKLNFGFCMAKTSDTILGL